MIPDPNCRAAAVSPTRSAAAAPRALSAQDHAATTAIAAAGSLLLRIQQDPPLRELLATEEIDALELENGARCRDLAEFAVAECQLRLGTLDHAAAALERATAAARRDFTAFRRAVRQTCDRAEAARLLPRRLPARPLRAFIGGAHAAYLAALTCPSAGPLAACGFDAARLCQSVSALIELASLDESFALSAAAAAVAADARSRALNRLNAWVRALLAAIQHALSRTVPPRARRRTGRDHRPAPLPAVPSACSRRMLPPRFNHLRD